MGRTHAAALSAIDGVILAAISTRSALPAAAELARAHGAELLSVDQMLARSDIDTVVIATPTDTHLELVRTAAQAGKQIICEKPLARTLAEGEALIDAARRAGVKLALAHVVRYFPEYAQARDAVRRGEIGTPHMLRATRGGSFPTVAGGWYANSARSGGVALDLMIHDFDWARWAFGPIERVYASGLTFAGHAGKDAAMVALRFSSGALGYAEGSWCYPSGFRTSFELAGSGGLLRHDSRRSQPLRYELAPGEPGQAGVALPAGGLHDDPYLLQMRDFVQWLRGGQTPRCTAEDAFEALRISLAALESIQTGRPVTLRE
jgi:UDP-N-acetylglucosamine 3-dehydrogenase